MNPFAKKIAETSPFKMWILHEHGSQYESNTMPIATRGKSGCPNMKWAINTLASYKNAIIKKVIFYEQGIPFGTYENGRYEGKYKTY